MNFNRIRNYNQVLLAALGTIGVIFLFIVTIFVGAELWGDLTYRYNRADDGVFTEEKAKELAEQNLRQQLISYGSPKLVDTVNHIYIIPVSHKSLEEPEESRGIVDVVRHKGGEDSYDKRYSRSYYGNLNNLILHDGKNNSNQMLFTERVNFNNYRIYELNDEIIITMMAADTDSYKDNLINLNDHKSLYIYSFLTKQWDKIKLDNATVVNYDFIYESKDLFISFGIDHDKNGIYDSGKEPSLQKRFNYENRTLEDVVPEEMRVELQKRIEKSE